MRPPPAVIDHGPSDEADVVQAAPAGKGKPRQNPSKCEPGADFGRTTSG